MSAGELPSESAGAAVRSERLIAVVAAVARIVALLQVVPGSCPRPSDCGEFAPPGWPRRLTSS